MLNQVTHPGHGITASMQGTCSLPLGKAGHDPQAGTPGAEQGSYRPCLGVADGLIHDDKYVFMPPGRLRNPPDPYPLSLSKGILMMGIGTSSTRGGFFGTVY